MEINMNSNNNKTVNKISAPDLKKVDNINVCASGVQVNTKESIGKGMSFDVVRLSSMDNKLANFKS